MVARQAAKLRYLLLAPILSAHCYLTGCILCLITGKLCEADTMFLSAQVKTLTSHYSKETGATIRGVDNPGMEKNE